MRRVFEQTSLFIGVYLLVALLRYPYITLPQQLGSMLQSRAQAAAIDLAVSDLDVDFPLVILAKRLAVSIPSSRGPLPLRLNDLRCDLSGWNLLRLRLASDCSLRAYRGEADARIVRALFDDSIELDARLSRLELDELPKLLPAELSGLLTLRWQGRLATDKASAEGEFRLELDQARYFQLQKIMGLFSIPEIQDLSAIAEGTVKERSLRVSQAQVQSTLGNVQGTAELELDERLQPRSYRAELRIELSAEGARHFGSLLALGSKSGGSAQTRRWQLSIEKTATAPLPIVVSSPLT